MARTRRQEQRSHRPHDLGPRLFSRGRYYAADLRPWGGGKPTLRSPAAKEWPRGGDRLDFVPENDRLARRWSWRYVEALQAGKRDLLEGRRAGPSVEDAVADYLAHLEEQVRQNQLSPQTLAHVESFLGTLKRSVSGDAGRVTTADLQAIIDKRAAKGYAPSTANTMRADWSGLFKWLGGPNPAAGVVLPAVPRHEPRAWTDAQLARLREAADGIDAARERPIARLLLDAGLATGARAAELRALRWEDFRPDTETVRISVQRPQRAESEQRTKGKRGRTALVLKPFLAEHDVSARRGLLLHRADGKPYAYSRIGRILEAICDAAGVAGTPHDMRRTYGRLFLARGGTLEGLKLALGHRSIRTTEQEYAAIRDEEAMQVERARMAGGLRLVR